MRRSQSAREGCRVQKDLEIDLDLSTTEQVTKADCSGNLPIYLR